VKSANGFMTLVRPAFPSQALTCLIVAPTSRLRDRSHSRVTKLPILSLVATCETIE